MPHVSKIKLKGDHADSLYKELLRTFERAFKRGKTKPVLDQFLTKTEKIMFAKRLAIIALLSRGASTSLIAEALAMSPSTAEKMLLKFENGYYNHIVTDGLGKKDIWDILESIFTVGGIMPPKVGKDRWKRFNQDAYNDRLMQS